MTCVISALSTNSRHVELDSNLFPVHCTPDWMITRSGCYRCTSEVFGLSIYEQAKALHYRDVQIDVHVHELVMFILPPLAANRQI